MQLCGYDSIWFSFSPEIKLKIPTSLITNGADAATDDDDAVYRVMQWDREQEMYRVTHQVGPNLSLTLI